MDTNKRIVVNTFAQHIRAIVNILMSLFATRYILLALGSSDFGIFSLIGSTIAMLGFITNALVVTTQRHLSYCHGANKTDEIRIVFSNSLFVHIIISIVLIMGLSLIEPLLFNGFLEIKSDRVLVAEYVYFIVITMLVLSILTSPFRALFIARENIVYISFIDILDGAIRLGLAIILLYINTDKLLTYAWMMLSISIFNLLAFSVYAKKHFSETCLWPQRKDISKNVIIKILDFAGWTFYSTGCIIGRNQGMAIVLNSFFGTIINTAYGIASQILNAVQFISQAIINAMSPQIIKAEGNKDRKRMLSLSEVSCKYSYLLLAIIVIPTCFEMPSILSIWLGSIPDYTIFISRILLISALVDQISMGLGVANQAIGNIRNYSITINTIKIITLPAIYILLYMGYEIQQTMWIYLAIEAVCSITRIPFLKYSAGLSVRHYITKVLLKISVPTILIVVACLLCTNINASSWRFLLTYIISMLTGAISIWITALTRKEKEISLQMIKIKR